MLHWPGLQYPRIHRGGKALACDAKSLPLGKLNTKIYLLLCVNTKRVNIHRTFMHGCIANVGCRTPDPLE